MTIITWVAHSCTWEIKIGPCESPVQAMAPKHGRLPNVIGPDSAFEDHPLLPNRADIVIVVVEVLVRVVRQIVRQTEIKTNGGHPL